MFSLSCFITIVCLLQIPDLSTAFHKRHSKGISLDRRSDSEASQPSAGASRGDRPPVIVFEDLGMKPLTISTQYGSVALSCEAMTRPAPSIHWLKNGKKITGNCKSESSDDINYENSWKSSSDWLGLSSTTSTLHLDCLDAIDEANYTCVAETPTSRNTMSTVLRVERIEEPSLKTLLRCASKGAPAKIYMATRSRLEYSGNTVQLYCRASGNPTPTITWYDGENNPIEDGRHFRVKSNGDLIIKDITWEDHMGVFKCEASNDFGTDVAEPFLYPTGRGSRALPF